MNIPFAEFDFRIQAVEPLILPRYKGSTLRGGFGYAFKRIVCALKDRECAGCLLSEKCIYSYVFETRPPPTTRIMRKYSAAPHPFLIEPPGDIQRVYKTGDELSFRFILIGKAIEYLPYFVYAFEELGRIGIGKGKAKYALKSVTSYGPAGESAVIYSCETKTLLPCDASTLHVGFPPFTPKTDGCNTLTLAFITPTRILYEGRLILDLAFHILIRNLVRRIALLTYFHGDGDPSQWDFKAVIEMAKGVRVKAKSLKWYDWERYSGRQNTRMKMGGFVGAITFEGEIAPFMPLIKAGEILHVGKGTAFGLGKYKIVVDDSARIKIN